MKLRKETLADYLYIILGTALLGFGTSVFLNRARLAPGGVSGIATMIYHVALGKTGHALEYGVIVLILSVPLYLLGVLLFGKEYGAKTLLGTLLMSLFITLFDHVFPEGILDYTKETSLWLCTLFSGVTCGAGIGLTMRSGSNSGGTDIIAQILGRYTPLDLGTSLLLVDGIIILASSFVFGIESALYAIVVSMMVSLILDRVILPFGTNYAKTVYIISPRIDELGDYIIEDLNRSGTVIYAKGLYSQTDKPILMTVVPKRDITRLTRRVKELDPTAFLIIQDTYHVLGEGFTPIDKLAHSKDVTQA